MKILYVFSTIVIFFMFTNAATPTISYHLAMPNPANHIFEVEMKITNISSDKNYLDIFLPVWRPGRYVIFDFASGVQKFSVVDENGKSLSWEKIEKSTWRIEKGKAKTLTIKYTIYANEFSLRTRGLNTEHAFINGAAVFMYAEEYRNLPITLTVAPYKTWHVTTGLEEQSKNIFTAPNYDYFVDCPLEIGNQKDFEFIVEGKKHVLSIFGEGNWNAETLIKDISTIIKTNKEFWGTLPYERYVFLVHITPNSGGGTEHINSTIMGTKPLIFKNPAEYTKFLNLVMHEFFHTWNVKQFRPQGIQPYNYQKENYTKELWIAEGITSYYDELLCVRASFISPEKYFSVLTTSVEEERKSPGNTAQSLTESSYDAWIKFWKNTQQAYNYETNYYSKGANVSLLLDLEIRQRSNNKHSLDDVMRAMYQRFPLSGNGYTVDDFQKIAEEFAQGTLQEFFTNYVHGTIALPFEKYFSYVGLEINVKDSVNKPSLGINTKESEGRTKVTRVITNSPAEKSGIDVDDEIVALNGFRINTSTLSQYISEYSAEEKITLTTFRNDIVQERTVVLENFGVPKYTVQKTSSPTQQQKFLYEYWLDEKWVVEKK